MTYDKEASEKFGITVMRTEKKAEKEEPKKNRKNNREYEVHSEEKSESIFGEGED